MEVLVFRTDIASQEKIESIQPFLNRNKKVLKWSIDIEDIDNVLRIEAAPSLIEQEVIGLISMHGFYVEPLMD